MRDWRARAITEELGAIALHERAEAAEARVKVLEEALRRIAKGEYHNEEEDYQLDSQCRCADVVAQAALAAKEKP